MVSLSAYSVMSRTTPPNVDGFRIVQGEIVCGGRVLRVIVILPDPPGPVPGSVTEALPAPPRILIVRSGPRTRLAVCIALMVNDWPRNGVSLLVATLTVL